ncbi:DUF192 domain-containing protein [Fodinibius salsisoli]|uniref:DUF192 domain-containing protein n=1 Tax=Fodinibius salsisoli TaxID=2820877 RepID=A0ABT3PSU4_9BACT|nr:DUF192 domain-containing protein [Fodinibius salsisoli]MCW9708923.1 DUF192 domain-containing protein [Fodinibius salsisoli]
MNRTLSLFLIAAFAMLTTACSQDSETEDNDPSSQDRSTSLEYVRSISFLSADTDTISTIEAALADDDKERSQGLMDVRSLPADKGMLFIFEENKPRGFWMANTPLPLDIIFVNADKQIVRIHHNAEPFSEKSLQSGKPAQYVIETNAGYCISHDIQEGMKVAF